MSQTRAQLDHKLTLLEDRAREFSPRQYARSHMPEYLAERVIGGFLLFLGAVMLLKQARAHRDRRARVHDALIAYGRW